MNEIFFIVGIVVIGFFLAGLIWDLYLVASAPVNVEVDWDRIDGENLQRLDRYIEAIEAIEAIRARGQA